MATATNLDCKDICAIIIACGEAGVSQFSYKGLKVTLNYENPKTTVDLSHIKYPKDNMTLISEESNRKEIENEEQEYIDDLAITDHQRYEQLIIQEELMDAEPDDSEA